MIKVMSSNSKLLSLMLAIFFFLWYWNDFEGDEYVVGIIEG